MWLATASDRRGPHLIPVSFWWDGARLVTATFENSRTLNDIRAQPRVRASIGTTSDVVMIHGMAAVVAVADLDEAAVTGYERASGVLRSTPGFVYVSVVPTRIQGVERAGGFSGRTVMRADAWLDDPVD